MQRHHSDSLSGRAGPKMTRRRRSSRSIAVSTTSGRSPSRQHCNASPPSKEWMDERTQRQDAILSMTIKRCGVSRSCRRLADVDASSNSLDSLHLDSSPSERRGSNVGVTLTTKGAGKVVKGTARLTTKGPRRSKSLDQDEGWYDSSKLAERDQCSLIERVSAYVDDSSVAGLSMSSTSTASLQATQLGLINVMLPSRENSSWDI